MALYHKNKENSLVSCKKRCDAVLFSFLKPSLAAVGKEQLTDPCKGQMRDDGGLDLACLKM